MREYKGKQGNCKYKDWSTASLEAAIQMVHDGATIRTAAEAFNVHHTTLSRGLRSKTTERHGQPTALFVSDETDLVGYISVLSMWGFPVTTFQIRHLVKNMLDRHGLVTDCFVNNLPGTEWASAFVKGHKGELSTRLANNIKNLTNNDSSIHESVIEMLHELCYMKPVRNVAKKKKLNVAPGKSVGQICNSE
uniref:HTH psq-type domain-containing protein n=1 Tax=Romanomermis culicivorax TaxID=13658 RepID=A0A915IV14_ROMCU